MLRYVIELLPDNSVLKKCYTKIRRAKNISRRAKRIPEYLKDNNFEVDVPTRRLDISIKEDIIEEFNYFQCTYS